MVRKPITDASVQIIPTFLAFVLLASSVAGISYGAFAEPLGGGLDELLQVGSVASLIMAGVTFLFSTFGFQDGSMIFTRAGVMFAVGYFVAQPLHETMFFAEIMEEHQRLELAEVADEIKGKEGELADAKVAAFDSCMRRHSMPPDSTCAEASRRFGQAELLVAAIEFVKDEELRGKDPVQTRGYLLDRASALEATEVVTLIGPGSTGLRGRGPRYHNAVKREPGARQAVAEAKAYEERCRTSVAECEDETTEEEAVAALHDEIAVLHTRSELLEAGEDRPGVLDRTRALESLIEGGEDGEDQSAWVLGRLVAAWFIALVMPLIVLVMKITAGDKLEPYLRKRWAGR